MAACHSRPLALPRRRAISRSSHADRLFLGCGRVDFAQRVDALANPTAKLDSKPPDAAEDALRKQPCWTRGAKGGPKAPSMRAIDGDPDEVLARLKIRRRTPAMPRRSDSVGELEPRRHRDVSTTASEMLPAERTPCRPTAAVLGDARGNASASLRRQPAPHRAPLTAVPTRASRPHPVRRPHRLLQVLAKPPGAPVTPGAQRTPAETTWLTSGAWARTEKLHSSSARHANGHLRERCPPPHDAAHGSPAPRRPCRPTPPGL